MAAGLLNVGVGVTPSRGLGRAFILRFWTLFALLIHTLLPLRPPSDPREPQKFLKGKEKP